MVLVTVEYKMFNKWTFDNDELFDLVTCGKKHGTCCLYDTDMLELNEFAVC